MMGQNPPRPRSFLSEVDDATLIAAERERSRLLDVRVAAGSILTRFSPLRGGNARVSRRSCLGLAVQVTLVALGQRHRQRPFGGHFDA